MKDVIENILNICDKENLKEFDVLLSTGKTLSLSSQNGSLDKYSVSSTNVAGVRVIIDRKVGISYSEDFNQDALQTMVNKACELTEYMEPNEHQSIIGIVKEAHYENPKTYQKDETSLEEKTQLSLQLELEPKLRNKNVISSPYNGYSEYDGQIFYGNSSGLLVSHKEKYFSCYTSALIHEGQKNSLYYESYQARTFKGLNSQYVIDESIKKAQDFLHSTPLPTKKYDCIFTPNAFSKFLGCYLSVFSGKSAVEGKTKLNGKIGEIIAHHEFTLMDCPQYQDGFSFIPFDSEGLMKREFTLIENGCLKTFAHNTATAKFLKTTTTASATRSPKGHLGVGLEQLVVLPGSSDEKALESTPYLSIVDIEGLHSGTNAISGDFSLKAKGYLMEGHNIKHIFNQVTISGNFFDLIKEIQGIGNRLHSTPSKTFFCPKIRFSNIQLAGA